MSSHSSFDFTPTLARAIRTLGPTLAFMDADTAAVAITAALIENDPFHLLNKGRYTLSATINTPALRDTIATRLYEDIAGDPDQIIDTAARIALLAAHHIGTRYFLITRPSDEDCPSCPT